MVRGVPCSTKLPEGGETIWHGEFARLRKLDLRCLIEEETTHICAVRPAEPQIIGIIVHGVECVRRLLARDRQDARKVKGL